eukprot:TRINITY_DN10190_c0_g2_i1.p1 TRINITY_DN10190_c0_g2~~TRINITY_DN10190_c0_g2_i1.p1  ORF type:complete len:105 (+),score=30.56 TRINITY_DN10190_c0_g2_i1:762-1076(+)
MSDAYATTGGGLNLKGMKKKKKKKDKKKMQTKTNASQDEALNMVEQAAQLTDAEKKFKKAQIKREMERIRAKASKSHKEKVAELNRYLDSLSEHHDIPKVSWTK